MTDPQTAADAAGRVQAYRERLLSRAVINWETGCWEWTARRNDSGYGRFFLAGRMRQAHRVAYELIVGPIPPGLQLDHLCRVRHCINPAHLEPVTPRENVMRGNAPSAQCYRRTHCANGHEYTAENTYRQPGFEGIRKCRTCNNAVSRAKRARRAAERASMREAAL